MFAFSNWTYWLLVSQLTSTSEIGRATTVYSLVVLIATLAQLGLEYPLLRRSSSEPSKVFSAALLTELVVILAAIPFVLYFIDNIYKNNLEMFGSVIAVGILLSLPLSFVSSFLLLGKFDVKKILIIDTLGVFIKFSSGYFLVTYGFGALGLLISFLLQSIFMSGSMFVFAKRKFGLTFPHFGYIKHVFLDGISNMPSKLSRTLIFSLSVVLLASYGIASSDIGIFYIALMISLVVGSLFSSIAYMIIPASSLSKRDMSFDTIRIVISFTAVLVVTLIASSKNVLFIIGKEYMQGESVLLVLCIGILPFSIVEVAISKFNYLGQSRRLLSLGLVQIFVFVATFLLLIPYYGSLGAAFSIVISFITSALLSIYWLERELIKYIINTCIAIVAGWILGLIFSSFFNTNEIINLFTSVLISVTVTLAIIIGLKNTSLAEIKHLISITIKSD